MTCTILYVSISPKGRIRSFRRFVADSLLNQFIKSKMKSDMINKDKQKWALYMPFDYSKAIGALQQFLNFRHLPGTRKNNTP